MWRAMWVACLAVAWLSGCGSGGNGAGEPDGLSAIELAEAFRDEAIRLALLDAQVTCQTVVCPLADDDFDVQRVDGVIVHTCAWDCLEATLEVSDGALERRRYVVILDWQRFAEGCWVEEVGVLAEVNSALCRPANGRREAQ